MKTPDTVCTASSATTKRNFSRKSTATEAQYERIDAMLSGGPKNTMEFRRAGIMSPASRIKEMNDRLGYFIASSPINVVDEWGFMHYGVALYEIHNRSDTRRLAQ